METYTRDTHSTDIEATGGVKMEASARRIREKKDGFGAVNGNKHMAKKEKRSAKKRQIGRATQGKGRKSNRKQ